MHPERPRTSLVSISTKAFFGCLESNFFVPGAFADFNALDLSMEQVEIQGAVIGLGQLHLDVLLTPLVCHNARRALED